ncbi:hypothetical protein ABDK00_008750 [Niabella insulamsoli]|uniref:hypothetical protein n=1 Tax=Niabella insulamsoli TaxID=3144874 RepID=UPI0031FC72B7
MDKKKQIERYQLEKFVSNKKLKFLVYDIENSETPDFVVNINKKLISIEHTRLINPKLQQVEQYKDRIIKNAQKKFEEKYSAKLYALLTFRNILLKAGKIEEEKYTDEVFNLIERIYLNNRKFEFRISSNRRKEKVSPTIESFSVDNTQNFSHWQHFGAYLVEWIDMKWLQNIITKKENNIAKYPKNYDENWLLLVSDFGTEASANRADFIDFSVIHSKFDKIYLFSYMEDNVTIIK